MTSKVFSQSLGNYPMGLSIQCGEVYCSQNYEDFSVSCVKCLQAFDFHDSYAFIVHLKECLASKEANSDNQFHGKWQNTGHNSSIISIKSDAAQESEHAFDTAMRVTSIKVEGADEFLVFESENEEALAESLQQSSTTESKLHLDPLNVEEQEEQNDLKLGGQKDKLTERAHIEALIDEYKRHPVLWNERLRKTAKRVTLTRAFQMIRQAMNDKFSMELTDDDVKKKILNLRVRHRRATSRSIKGAASTTLWFYQRLSYINEAFDSVKPETTNEDATMQEEESATSMVYDEVKKKNVPLFSQRKVISALIAQYKECICLWDAQSPHYYDNLHRDEAYNKIKQFIDEKFEANVGIKEITTHISRLRRKYRRVQRVKHTNIPCWFYDKLSFIEHTADEVAAADDDLKQADFDDEKVSPMEPDEIEDSPKIQTKREEFSEQHLRAMLELYKSTSILWDQNHPSNTDRMKRIDATNNIVAKLCSDHDCQISPTEFRAQIRSLRHSYARLLWRQANEAKTEAGPPPWYYNLLSFLKPFTDISLTKQPEVHEDIKFLIDNRQLMLDFIEEFKSHPCLWDESHEDRSNLLANEKAFDELLNVLTEKNILITEDQLHLVIAHLHSIVVYARKLSAFTKTPPNIWFYEHIKFMGANPRALLKLCKHCNKRFRTNAEWKKHMAEIGDYPYKCDKCNIGFFTWGKYHYHQKSHQEPLKCSLCDFTAKSSQNFRVHMNRHNGIRRFQCKMCEMACVTSSDLKKHELTHSKAKPFVCEQCGKGFGTNSHMRMHMRRHLNERNHKCEVCGKAFFRPGLLKAHAKLHSTDYSRSKFKSK